MSNNGRKRLRGTAAAQANGPHEDAATGVVPPAAQAAAVLPAVAGGILAAAAPHAMAVPRVVIPSGCHLFGKPATTGLHDGRYTVPIRLAEGGDWIDSYSSFIARKTKDDAVCLLPHADGVPSTFRTAGGGWPNNARMHLLRYHPWSLTLEDVTLLKLDPITRKPLSAGSAGGAVVGTDTLAVAPEKRDDEPSLTTPAAGTLGAIWGQKVKTVDIADHAPKYIAEGRASYAHMLSSPMSGLLDSIAAALGGSITWCSRTHLTHKTDEFMAEQLSKSNRILKAEIIDVPNAKCSITFDAGPAKNGHSFLALTLHWMTASPVTGSMNVVGAAGSDMGSESQDI